MVSALARGGRVALDLLAVRVVFGPWPTAVLLAAGCLWLGVRAWYRWENWPRRPHALVPELVTAQPAGSGHVTFARALSAVATEYLDRCEQEANRP
jgi:hypothetical protein